MVSLKAGFVSTLRILRKCAASLCQLKHSIAENLSPARMTSFKVYIIRKPYGGDYLEVDILRSILSEEGDL